MSPFLIDYFPNGVSYSVSKVTLPTRRTITHLISYLVALQMNTGCNDAAALKPLVHFIIMNKKVL